MFKRVRTWLFIGSLLSVAHPAFAQDWADPEGGEEGDSSSWNAPTNAPPPANTPPPAAAPRSNPPASNWGNADAPANEEAPQTSGTSDHAKYAVGHVGVGFFGITSIPYGFGSFDYTPTNITGGGRPTAGSLSAPTLGVRWWLSELLALEGAIGIGLTSNSIDAAGTSLDGDSNFGFAVHLGAPLALYHSGHYKFLIIPELNFGYADGSRPSSTPAAAGETDLLSGMLLQVGARAGAEIQFGFIGIPELALQASIGLLFSYTSNGVDACLDNPATGQCTNLEFSTSGVNVNTTLNNDPWDIFTSSITAIYYF